MLSFLFIVLDDANYLCICHDDYSLVRGGVRRATMHKGRVPVPEYGMPALVSRRHTAAKKRGGIGCCVGGSCISDPAHAMTEKEVVSGGTRSIWFWILVNRVLF